MPKLKSGPLNYKNYAHDDLNKSLPYLKGTGYAIKQAVFAPSMLYLLYLLNETVEGYPKDGFMEDLVAE